MQHVVQIAFDFDDDKVKQIIEGGIEAKIDEIVRNTIMDHMAPMVRNYYSFNKQEQRDWTNFNDRVSNELYKIIDEHRQEIIDLAVKQLVKSVRQSKAFKEKLADAIE